MIDFQKEQLLKEGEYVIDRVRKHWIVYLRDFILHAFGCFVFMISAYFLASRGAFSTITIEASYGAMTLIGFVLIFWVSFFYAWTKEYFDVWYVTNQHIIAVNQKEMFHRDEAFMELTRIQDVIFEKDTFLSNLLGYGRLRVQSAGTEQEFTIEYVRNVELAAHKIMELRDEAQGKMRAQNVDSRTQSGV